jgi:hypothetical protein
MRLNEGKPTHMATPTVKTALRRISNELIHFFLLAGVAGLLYVLFKFKLVLLRM